MYSIIPLTEAKAKLSEIVDRVSQGEEFIITRHDEMIAKLSPLKSPSLEDIKQTIQHLRDSRRGVHISLHEIAAWKKRGRK